MTSPTPSEPRTGHKLYHGAALTPALAWAVVALSVASIYAMQIGLVAAGVTEIVAAVIGYLPVIGTLVLIAARGRRRALGLAWPRRARFLVAAVLVGCAAWYVNLVVVEWLMPDADTRTLERIVEQTPLVPTLLAIAVAPAIAEELLFRGVLARALARFDRGGRFTIAIVLSSALFGLYHLAPVQMLPTFMLGLALAYLSLRADSVVPAMIAHGLNNTIAIVISREEIPGVASWVGAHPVAMLGGALVCVGAGLAVAATA